jgi:Flp pilus assembly pilin Flp
MIRARRGQTILEYTIIVGIVAVMLSYMGTGIKRGLQSLVKVTADQVGNQQNSDQDFNDAAQGYMEGSNTQTQQNNAKQVLEAMYVTNTVYNESSITMVNTITNGGFSPSN